MRLSNYFKAVASKTLSPVEVDPCRSNQHELNGVNALKEMFGPNERKFDKARFIYLGDDISDYCSCTAGMTWYDARFRNPKRTEYRFYYQANEVMERASAGDLLVIGLTTDDNLVIVVAKADTSAELQLAWLLNTSNTGEFIVNINTDEAEIGFVEKYILAQLDIQVELPDLPDKDTLLKSMLDRFGEDFPSTAEFSSYARETLGEDLSSNADEAIIQSIEREELLFKILEEYIVQKRLDRGFASVDEFAEFAKSWINRRYSRAGHCFEKHLKYIFDREGVAFSSQQTTEGQKRPDFVMPHIDAYHYVPDELIDDYVTVLAAKTSAKDRWRQALSEADRLKVKYLITLEPSISENQTDEMRNAQLQLVVPEAIKKSYTPSQQEWLLTLSEFIAIVKERQDLDWQQYIPTS